MEYDDDFTLEDPSITETEVKKKPRITCFCIIIALLLLTATSAILLFIYIQKKSSINNWENSYDKAKVLISQLTLTQKLNLLYGTENMIFHTPEFNDNYQKQYLCVGKINSFEYNNKKFNGMCLQDGPSGIRFAEGTSISWQAPINTAATFNKNLIYEIGKAQGEESKQKGINTLLSPCVNIMRNPQGGRGWEGFGEDPYLSGIAASQLIKGIQSSGVIATVKHFVANEIETYRHASSSNIELKALMDIYVEPFYRAVKADVGAVMTSFNAVNDVYTFENKFLINDVLKDMLNFKGFVMSDWWGVYNNDTKSINNGLDMNMPGGMKFGQDFTGRNNSYWSDFEQQVKNGKISENRINDAATRIIATMYKMQQLDDNFPDIDLWVETKTDQRKNLQKKAATESIILLKNDDNILPIKNNIETIAIIGNEAYYRDCIGRNDDNECRNKTNEVMNGHIPLGYGSGSTTFGYLITPFQAINEYCEKQNIKVLSSCNLYYIDQDREGIKVHVQGVENVKGGANVASKANITIIFVGVSSGEELEVENTIGDRIDLNLWHGADELIEKVSDENNNIIVVINAPSVVNMPWLNKVKAVIFAGFPGAESGHAISDILFGVENPSGHLPFVWGDINDYGNKINFLSNLTIIPETGKSWKDTYRYDGIGSGEIIENETFHKEQYNYSEGLYVGQRWFNKNNKTFIFPFGYGLSYTMFEYKDLKVSIDKDGLKSTFNVCNVGKVIGKAVPMMFITFPEYIGDYPEYILKGFEKVEVDVNETKEVTIIADDHALSYFDVNKNNYVRVNSGMIKVYIAENGDPKQAKLSYEIDAKY